MSPLLSRETVIALAIAGGVLSVVATILRARLGASRTTLLSALSYAFMGASIVLFLALGFKRP